MLGLRGRARRALRSPRSRPGAGAGPSWSSTTDGPLGPPAAGDSHTQHTPPDLSVHLVAERDRSGIMGVLTGRFYLGSWRARRKPGFGIFKFRPAGFHPFLGASVSTLTDRRASVAEVFGLAGDDLVADLPGRPRRPRVGRRRGVARAAPTSTLYRQPLVDQVMTDRDITRSSTSPTVPASASAAPAAARHLHRALP